MNTIDLSKVKTISDFNEMHEDVAPLYESFYCGQVIIAYCDNESDNCMIASVETDALDIASVSYSDFEDVECTKIQFITSDDLSEDDKKLIESNETTKQRCMLDKASDAFTKMVLDYITE